MMKKKIELGKKAQRVQDEKRRVGERDPDKVPR